MVIVFVELYHYADGKSTKAFVESKMVLGSKTPGLWRPLNIGDVYLITDPKAGSIKLFMYGIYKTTISHLSQSPSKTSSIRSGRNSNSKSTDQARNKSIFSEVMHFIYSEKYTYKLCMEW